MATKISSKIVGWDVQRGANDSAPADSGAKIALGAPGAESSDVEASGVEALHEKIKRPQVLEGATYKIKAPASDHALYVTINDMVVNAGTEHERRLPFEIFINSKDMSYYQWVSALTLMISAVLRKGGDATFMVDELKDVFDPKGGYFKGGSWMPSVVAEIGHVIEQHMKAIGLLPEDELDEHQRAFIEEKKQSLLARANSSADSADNNSYPASSALCTKCHTKAVIMADGCAVCLSCGDSKCG